MGVHVLCLQLRIAAADYIKIPTFSNKKRRGATTADNCNRSPLGDSIFKLTCNKQGLLHEYYIIFPLKSQSILDSLSTVSHSFFKAALMEFIPPGRVLCSDCEQDPRSRSPLLCVIALENAHKCIVTPWHCSECNYIALLLCVAPVWVLVGPLWGFCGSLPFYYILRKIICGSCGNCCGSLWEFKSVGVCGSSSCMLTFCDI